MYFAISESRNLMEIVLMQQVLKILLNRYVHCDLNTHTHTHTHTHTSHTHTHTRTRRQTERDNKHVTITSDNECHWFSKQERYSKVLIG